MVTWVLVTEAVLNSSDASYFPGISRTLATSCEFSGMAFGFVVRDMVAVNGVVVLVSLALLQRRSASP
jgi:hypothetical protein